MTIATISATSDANTGLLRIWSSWIIAAVCSVALVLGFAASSPRFLHWFVIPVLLCGVFTGKDAIDWILGRVHTFDLMGVFGIFGYFFFFIAPLLHIHWDFWMWEVVAPPDWRDWLGGVAILNVLGLIAFRVVFNLRSRPRRADPGKTVWVIDFHVFPAIIAGVLVTTALLQSWVYLRSGGISAFVALFQESYQGNEDAFAGWGWIFMISESFPIIAALAVVTYMQRRRFVLKPLYLVLFLVVFFGLEIYFGGLRGSRLNTAEALFWAVGAYHYFIKPISRTAVLGGTVALVAFMYVYGFYKDGKSITTAFEGADARAEAEQQSHRSMHGLVLGDLGRADVQAFLLYKTVTDSHGFQRANGQTYLAAFSLLVPQRFRPALLVTKEQISSDLIWGAGVYVPGIFWSTRIYGLAGEAILNFGYAAVPVAFLVLALVLSQLERWVCSLHREDARVFLVPFLTYLVCVWAVTSDLDNVVFSIIKQGFVVGLVLIASTKRVRILRPVFASRPALAAAC